MPDVPLPVLITPGDIDTPGGAPPSGAPGPGDKPLTGSGSRGLDPNDREDLLSQEALLGESMQLWNYAKSRNKKTKDTFDVLADFAFGKQFLTYGDELHHLTSRPKRNVTFDIIRHKTAMVTEPPVVSEVFPRGADDLKRAQLGKAALEFIQERTDRRESVDESTRWAALVGTGIVHQGWDPVSSEHAERVVDPRHFDPDPDHIHPKHWLYCFEWMRLPLSQIKTMFPATGDLVERDNGPTMQEERQPWQSASTAENINIQRGSGQHATGMSSSVGPEMGTVVFYWSQGHYTVTDEEVEDHVIACPYCGSEFESEPPSPDASQSASAGPLAEDENLTCPTCGIGPVPRKVRSKTTKRLSPLYPRGRRLIVFAPLSDVMLYVGEWPCKKLRTWPYKGFRWYKDPRKWWGISETQTQWSMQILNNKLMVILSENAIANGAPKVILPQGIGFEHKPWTNRASEVLIAKDWRLIDRMRSFQTGDLPQALFFLLPSVMNWQREQGGYQDVALGQLRSTTRLSGQAIERAQSAAEVPVRDHLRERYRFEPRLSRDDLAIANEKWTAQRTIRIHGEFGEMDTAWLTGDDLADLDVIVTNDPQSSIERTARAEIAMELFKNPDPMTGQPIIGPQEIAAWIGLPVELLRAAAMRRQQQEAEEVGSAGQNPLAAMMAGGGGGGVDLGGLDLASLVQGGNGSAAGLNPTAVLGG